jgi:hypothetical protein
VLRRKKTWIVLDGEETRDHLITPFQCERCHFRNIQNGIGGEKEKDEGFLELLRKCP